MLRVEGCNFKKNLGYFVSSMPAIEFLEKEGLFSFLGFEKEEVERVLPKQMIDFRISTSDQMYGLVSSKHHKSTKSKKKRRWNITSIKSSNRFSPLGFFENMSCIFKKFQKKKIKSAKKDSFFEIIS